MGFPEEFESSAELTMYPTKSEMEKVGLGTSREERKQYMWTGKTYQHVDDIDTKYFINPKTNRPFRDYGRGEKVKEGFSNIQSKVTDVMAPVVKPLNTFMDESILGVASDMFVDGSKTALKFGYNKLIPQKVKDVGGWTLDKYDDAMLGYSQQFNIAPFWTEVGAAVLEAGGPSIAKKISKGGPLIKQLFQKPNKLALATTGSTVGGDIFTQGSKADNLVSSMFAYSDEVKSKAIQTGDTGRIGKAVVQSPDIAGSAYRKSSLYTDAKGTLRKGTPTSTIHHVGGLDENGRAIIEHFSWDKIPTDGISPIVEKLKNWGIKLGNSRENLTDIFDIYTLAGRRQQVRSIYQQIDGVLPESVIDDLLGGSKLDLKDLTEESIKELEAFRKIPGNRGKGFPRDQLETIGGKDIFPTIELKPKGWKKGQPFKTWRPKDINEFNNRFAITAQKMGVDYKGFDWKKIRVDPKSITLSPDHKNVHNLIDLAKETPGNPLYKIEQMITNGKFKNLSVDQASKMLANSQVYQEKLLANVLHKRYKAIEKFYNALPVSERGGFGNTRGFSDLGAAAKQRFVKENAQALGVLGGLGQDIQLNQIKKIKWNPNTTEVFGWKPQTLTIK